MSQSLLFIEQVPECLSFTIHLDPKVDFERLRSIGSMERELKYGKHSGTWTTQVENNTKSDT